MAFWFNFLLLISARFTRRRFTGTPLLLSTSSSLSSSAAAAQPSGLLSYRLVATDDDHVLVPARAESPSSSSSSSQNLLPSPASPPSFQVRRLIRCNPIRMCFLKLLRRFSLLSSVDYVFWWLLAFLFYVPYGKPCCCCCFFNFLISLINNFWVFFN